MKSKIGFEQWNMGSEKLTSANSGKNNCTKPDDFQLNVIVTVHRNLISKAIM